MNQAQRRWRLLAIVVLGAFAAVMLFGAWKDANPRTGDLGSFIASGRAASEGLNPYGIYALTGRAHGISYPNLNPPISVLFFRPFAAFEPEQLFPAWYVVNLASYLVALALLARAYPRHAVALRIVWALGLVGAWHSLQLAEIYLPITLIGVLAWLALMPTQGREFDKGGGGSGPRPDPPPPRPKRSIDQARVRWREIAAGVLLGVLVAIKPNFVLWPALLFPAGYRRVSITAGLTAVVVSAWPAVVLGPRVYPQWLAAAFQLNAQRDGPYGNVVELAMHLGAPSAIGLLLTGLIVLALAALLARHRPTALDTSAIGIIASLLLLPWTLEGYLLLLLPIFFSRPWTGLLRIVVILLILPVVFFPDVVPTVNDAALLLLAGVYLPGLVSAAAASCRRGRKRGAVNRRLRFLVSALLLVVIGIYSAMSLANRRLIDFGSFIASGRAASQGLDPYGVYRLSARVDGVGLPNLNPPLSILVLEPVAWHDPHLLFAIWYVVNAALYLLILWLLRRAYPEHATLPRQLWALSIFGFWIVLLSGQVYVLIALIATLAWLALRGGHRSRAGVLIGLLVALKPNFVLWPVLLFVSGRRREAVLSGMVAAGLSALPAVVYGPSVYLEWIRASAETARLTGTRGTLIEFANAIGLPSIGVPLTALLIVLAIAWAWRHRQPVLDLTAYALVTSLLLLPETNPGYLLVLLPLFFSRRWSPLTVLAAAVMVAPWPLSWYVLGSRIHVAALLLLLPAVLRETDVASDGRPEEAPIRSAIPGIPTRATVSAVARGLVHRPAGRVEGKPSRY